MGRAVSSSQRRRNGPDPKALVRDRALLAVRLQEDLELLGDLLARVAQHVLADALPVLVADVHAARPAAVLAQVDGAFMRTAAAHGRSPPRMISTVTESVTVIESSAVAERRRCSRLE